MNFKHVYIIFLSFCLTMFTPYSMIGIEKNQLNSFINAVSPQNSAPDCNVYKEYSDQPMLENSRNAFFQSIYDGYDAREYNWYFKHLANGYPPSSPPETSQFVNKYDGYFLGDVSKKVLYLTFDEGYENGYTSKILDTLKKNNVKAAFFVVKPYITSNPDLIKRMIDEGHLVCNHSARHPSMASIHDQSKFIKELSDVEEAFSSLTGKQMSKFFRPPMGKYSELSLHYTKDYGYKTIFWSFAYKDWEPNNQPDAEYAKKRILSRTHNGAIILLHAVSRTNTEILDDLIKAWKEQGYEIKNLNELPQRTQ